MNVILFQSFFHLFNHAYRYPYLNNYKIFNYKEKLSTFQSNLLLISSLRDTSFVDDADDKIIPPIVISERRSKQLVNDSNNIINN